MWSPFSRYNHDKYNTLMNQEVRSRTHLCSILIHSLQPSKDQVFAPKQQLWKGNVEKYGKLLHLCSLMQGLIAVWIPLSSPLPVVLSHIFCTSASLRFCVFISGTLFVKELVYFPKTQHYSFVFHLSVTAKELGYKYGAQFYNPLNMDVLFH